jgi:transposase InsO family protein
MPWLATDAVKERTKFVLEWERRWELAEGGRVNMAELCRTFGVSRQTGYDWVARYREAGSLDALEERSRRPHHSPTKVSDEIEAALIAARKKFGWGGVKLRAVLADFHPEIDWPSPSCISALLDRNGLTRRRRVRRRTPIPVTRPFADCDRPNSVWCIDFKGKFRTGDGEWCHVLTIVDAYSRFLIRAEALTRPDGNAVQRVLDGAFTEFGIPDVIRTDNGPPFASTGAGGLTSLSVWWLQLGIRVERIEPGKPQQNGRQERLHRTLEEVVGNPAANARAQQRAIDIWRRQYNEVRPHEALSLRRPGDVYQRSSKRYPRKLQDSRDVSIDPNEVYRLDKNGRLRWRDRWVHISNALSYAFVRVSHTGESWTEYAVTFGEIFLGTFDTTDLKRGFRVPRRRRPKRGEVSGMSLD